MIQRIQTIFMFLVAVCMVMMLFFPIWTKQNPSTGDMASLDVFHLVHQNKNSVIVDQNTIYMVGLIFLSNILAFTSIFSYRKRMMQIAINLVNTLVISSTLGISVYLIISHGQKFFDPGVQGSYGVGIFMPGLALILNSMANRFIRRDENLVRSADRIR